MHLLLLVGCLDPTKVIRVCNKDKPWFDDQGRYAFDHKQEAHLWWTRDRPRVNFEEFVSCQPYWRPSNNLVSEILMFL